MIFNRKVHDIANETDPRIRMGINGAILYIPINGAILYISMTGNLLHINYSLLCFHLTNWSTDGILLAAFM